MDDAEDDAVDDLVAAMTELASELGENTASKTIARLDAEDVLALAEEAQGDVPPTPGTLAFGYGDARKMFGMVFQILQWLGKLVREGKKLEKEVTTPVTDDRTIEHARATLVEILRQHRIGQERADAIAQKYVRRLYKGTKRSA